MKKGIMDALRHYFYSVLNKKGIYVAFLICGPIFHSSIFIYIFGYDIIHIASYAEMSLAFPISIAMLLIGGNILLVIQVKKRSARLGIGLIAVLYVVVALIFPAFNNNFNFARIFVLSPWSVIPTVSPVWAFLSWASITCYILSLIGIIRLDGIHTFVFLVAFIPLISLIMLLDANLLMASAGLTGFVLLFVGIFPRVFLKENSPIIGKHINPYTREFRRRQNERYRFRYCGTVAFVTMLVVGSVLVSGNLVWYTRTYTLHYNANSVSVEYWLGADEQEFTGIFNLNSPAIPVSTGDNVTIDLSPLESITGYMGQPDKFYAVRFLINENDRTQKDLYRDYHCWYFLSYNFTKLTVLNVSNVLAYILESARNGTSQLNITCVGYHKSRIQALGATKACIVLTSGIGAPVPMNITGNHPEFNATAFLYDKFNIRIQAALGCGPGYLTNLNESTYLPKNDYTIPPQAPYIQAWQNTRVEGPAYYRRVIEGVMLNIEKIHHPWRQEMVESFVNVKLGMNITGNGGEHTFWEFYWSQNTMSDADYQGNLSRWNDFIDRLYYNVTWPNGTTDESLRFKLINCGIQENLIDYFDGDPDMAMFYHNLGFGTHFAVDGYMFYRGSNQPYWVYGYCRALARKPKVVPYEERLVLLGCIGSKPYRNDYRLERLSCFKPAGGDWTRDVNGDGEDNGFDALLLDIMMVGACGIPRVCLWPGPGPRSSCCDYREWPRNLVGYNESRDFFIEMASILNKSWDIQFAKLPSDEHYWDKVLTDIIMDFRREKSLLVLLFFAGLFTGFILLHGYNIYNYGRDDENNKGRKTKDLTKKNGKNNEHTR
ncbi:MAG: hypothetical protein ACTSXP_12120 [Promethearchaeota archaeon]